jgi:hypothetical protein
MRRRVKSSSRRPRSQRAQVFKGIAVLIGLGVPTKAQAEGKVVTISEVTIVGRVQKPIAAVDVARIQPKMTLAELRQPFLDRIEKAIYRAPF